MPDDRLTRLLGFLERDPGNLALRKDVIRAAHDSRSWQLAAEMIEIGLQAHPQDAELLALCGYSCLQSQRHAEAEQALQSALALGVEPAEVRYNLAVALFKQRRYGEAVELLNAPLMPFELPIALLLRARCQHHLLNLSEAVADCQALLGVDGRNAEANGLLALLLYEQGFRETAHQHADRALESDPGQVEALLALASIQADAANLSGARATFRQLLQADSRCGRAHLGLALIELTEQRLDEANQHIELAVAHMPDHVGTWHVLAWIRLMLGDVAGAGRAFTSALALDRNFSETHGGLAVVAALEHREEEASAAIKRALRLDAQCMSAQYADIVLLQRHGRSEEARAVLESVLSRPVPHRQVQFRDLVALQMQRHAGHP
jgi:tetratricopeptide (TPR) repeat protein